MAPILKEFESPVATATTTSPAAPQAKSPNETPTRPQPVALEIPVTINGARTVEGSDKRAPFSESTQTVLVFPHGAVIRIATPLLPGQLVFLTNEKTKKEVVCQVVKSKASGSAGSYVELQFTEPSLAFWGLQIPGASAAPAVPRPVAPSSPVVHKPAVPAPQVVAKPPVAAKPVAPAPPSTSPAKPIVPPPPPAAIPPAPINVVPAPVGVAPHAPAQELPKAVPAPEITAKVSGVQESSVAPVSPPIANSTSHQPAGPVLPLRDYSKQIDALFAVPQAPPTRAPEARVTPAAPTTEDLKLQAARLQEQLSSLLFTEKPSLSAAPPSAPPVLYTPENAANELSAKLADIIHAGPAATVTGEPKSVTPIRKPAPGPLGADEEVKIPSWLAPISQNAEVAMESSDTAEASHDHGVSVNSEESYDALVASSSSRPETAVFGGQLLGESSVSATEAATTRSKKGLFLGLAAAGVLIIGGGAWYYGQNQSSSATVARTHSGSDKPSSELAPVSNSPAAPLASTAASSTVNPSTTSASRPATAIPAPSSPFSAPAVSALPPKNSKPTPKNEEEEVAAPAKPSLGDVHLAAPVVNHNTDSQQDSDAFASIDTKSIPSGADPLASAATHRNGPAAPAPLRVGGDVKPAQLLRSVAPEYPAIAKAQHVSGRVQIDALIDASGNVTSVKILSGPALLHRAALDAVKQWKYSPAVLDGQPTVTHVSVNVDFRNQ
jgi:protein TonB